MITAIGRKSSLADTEHRRILSYDEKDKPVKTAGIAGRKIFETT